MADYNYDIQKLYLEMFLADAESFVRVQNIFQYESFDRKLQPIAKYLKEYVDTVSYTHLTLPTIYSV